MQSDKEIIKILAGEVEHLIKLMKWERSQATKHREENERLREALRDVVEWADDLQIYAEPEHHMHPVFYKARAALEEKE